MEILVMCDNGVGAEAFRAAFRELETGNRIRVVKLDRKVRFAPSTESEKKLAQKPSEFAGTPRQLVRAIGDSDILVVNYAPVTGEVMDASSNLKLIGVTRSGPANVDLEAASERRILVVCAPDTITGSVAEFTMGLLLTEVRKIRLACCTLKKGEEFKANRRLYRDATMTLGPELAGKTLGIVGLGRIGKQVALKAKALGMEVVCYDPYIPRDLADEVGAETVKFDTLLREADFVTLHSRLTPETTHIIGAKQLALMKRTAYLVNTARGELVDERALYTALKKKEIAGAALDVVEEEPISLRNPLLGLDNVTITPHIAAVTSDAALKSATIIAEEIARFAKGDKLTRLVPELKS